MRRGFVKVHHSIEYVEIRVSLLKSLHVFTQALFGNLRIGSADTRIISCADVNKMFIEALLLVRSLNHALTRLTVEQVFKVVTDLAVVSFLTSVVSLYRFAKKLMIGFT